VTSFTEEKKNPKAKRRFDRFPQHKMLSALRGKDGSKRHLAIAGVFALTYLLMGMNFASLGPLLPEIRDQAMASLVQSGALFGVRGAGYLVGALLTLFIDKFARFAMLWFACWVVLAGICAALIPLADRLVTVALCIFFVGVAMGALDSGANAVIMWEFDFAGVRVDPYLHLIHCTYAIGSFASPLLMRYITRTYTHKAALWTLAGLYILIPFAFLFLRSPRVRSLPKPDLRNMPTLERAASIRNRNRRKRLEWAIVLICGSTIAFYLGLESGTSGYLYTYASEEIVLPDDEVAWLNSAFWGCFALGRLAATVASTRIRPHALMIGTSIFATVGALVPIVFGASRGSVWAGMLILGFFISPCFPTVFTFCELNMNLTGKHASIIVISGSVGDIAVPIIMSNIFGQFGLLAFPMLLTASATLMLIAFVVAVFFARQLHGSRFGATNRRDKAVLISRESDRATSRGSGSLMDFEDMLYKDALTASEDES
jgi:FHS family Na+ dependent glucose MFS transporter 1